jgi:hypothetical protein
MPLPMVPAPMTEIKPPVKPPVVVILLKVYNSSKGRVGDLLNGRIKILFSEQK